MNIAFFDSGIGGLSVLREAIRQLPGEHFLYYADTSHVPYGTKPKNEVKKYVFEAVEAIREQGVKALVIACNTATSIAVDELRAKYSFPIIGMEPAVKPAVEANVGEERRVLVMATPLTLQEQKYHNLVSKVDDHHLVDPLPMPELVQFCERLEFSEETVLPYLKHKLSAYDWSRYGAIVLGCTHFPFFRRHLEQLVPEHVRIMDGSAGTVKRLKQLLQERGLRGDGARGELTFMSSSGTESDMDRMKQALGMFDA